MLLMVLLNSTEGSNQGRRGNQGRREAERRRREEKKVLACSCAPPSRRPRPSAVVAAACWESRTLRWRRSSLESRGPLRAPARRMWTTTTGLCCGSATLYNVQE